MVHKKPRILIVDDDHSLCEVLTNILDYAGYNVEVVYDGKTALAKIASTYFDLVLLDLKLPNISGTKVLKEIMQKESYLPVIMISAEGTIHSAVEATKLGAYDFLEKPLDSERVLVTIKNALKKGMLEREKAHLLENVKKQYIMVGETPQIKHVRELIYKAASTDSKVLIEGENGTGKELVARAIHTHSRRAAGPFVAVNCAAIPESLIESELFGYRKGAFTGALTDKPGKFHMAESGTLFFDEVGDMSLMTQAKVLRVLEEEVIEMIGGNEIIPVDVRVIAATNKELEKEMKRGNFREDLYFRLNVLEIKVPPLRERRQDIPLLVEHFMQLFCQEHGVPEKFVTPRAMDKLMNYSWPGNVRELKNLIEKLMILVDSPEIRPFDIGSVVKNYPTIKSNDVSSLKQARQDFEREFIREKLALANWNVTKAAKMLGIPRTYLYKKMKKFGIEI